jgi:hypothetical protein
MSDVLNFKSDSQLNAELMILDIQMKRIQLLEFCRKAIHMPTFDGLRMEEHPDDLILKVPGNENELRIPLYDLEKIDLDGTYFEKSFPPQIYLIFEGLAAVFSGTFVVTYFEGKDKLECKVSIIDGVYTHCGERCLVRDVVFPQIES